MTLSILIPSHNEPKIHLMLEETEKFYPDAQIIVCNDRYGKGKGWAIREALQHATGDYIAFIDGDMDIDCRMFNRLIPFLDQYDIVVGRKQIRGRITRRLVTKLSRLFIKLLFNIGCDTQTGIKIFKRAALSEWKEDGYLFDLEILFKAKNAGFKIIEVPVEVTPYGATSKRLKIKNVFSCLISAFKIWVDII